MLFYEAKECLRATHHLAAHLMNLVDLLLLLRRRIKRRKESRYYEDRDNSSLCRNHSIKSTL